MAIDLKAPTVRQYVVEKLAFGLRSAFTEEMLHALADSIKVDVIIDDIARRFFIDVRAHMLAGDPRDVHFSESISVPANWYQHLKLDLSGLLVRCIPRFAARHLPTLWVRPVFWLAATLRESMKHEYCFATGTRKVPTRVCPHVHTERPEVHFTYLAGLEVDDL